LDPVHPGEIFKQAYLEPLNITTTKAAEMMGVSRKHLSRFINRHVSIGPEFSLRLQAFTGKSANAWLNIQNNYDLWQLKDKKIDVVAA